MEVMVVMIIIGVLMAMLMPTVSLVVDRAKRLSCASKLRGLAAGVLVYATENRNSLPYAGDSYEMSRVGNWQNWWTSEFYPIQWYGANGNLDVGAAKYLEDEGVLNQSSAMCPGMTSYLDWGAGNRLGIFRTSYIYWGAPNHYGGRGEKIAQNVYPPPFWKRKLITEPQIATTPAPIPLPGVGTKYSNPAGYATTAIVRSDETPTPPLFSDLTWSTPWRKDFSHGKALETAWVNTAYSDGRVSGRRPDLANPSMWLLGWGSSPIMWYR